VAARRLRVERTLGPLVVEWIERELVHGPGDVQGQPIELDDEQALFLFRAYEIDDLGRRRVRRAVFSRPKGRAKSELAAMLVCAEALGPVRFAGWDVDGRPLGRPVQSPYIPVLATEEAQAGNVYAAVEFMLQEGAIAASEGLDVGMTRTFLPEGGSIRPVTAKAASKEGGRETFAVFDETHLFTNDELRRLHATIRRNLAKRKTAEPWSLETSTMYAPGEESVAEASHAYAQAVLEGRIRDDGFLFDHRDAPAGFNFDDDEELRVALEQAYGDAAERMDLDRLISEARDPQTDRSDFVRYFLNRPTKRQRGQWIAPERWSLLGDGEPLADETTVCLGLDGSRTYDTTVVAWAHKADDGRIDVDARVFSVRPSAPHHEFHEGGQIDFEAVEGFVVDLFDRFKVLEAVYDPRYLDRSADLLVRRLPQARIAAVEPQSRLMRDALSAFERGVLEGVVRHRADPILAAHVDAAGVDRGESNEVRRVFKIDRAKPIDAAVACALAYWRAVSAKPKPRTVVVFSNPW
jgi:phage terminase large subunit-like protein